MLREVSQVPSAVNSLLFVENTDMFQTSVCSRQEEVAPRSKSDNEALTRFQKAAAKGGKPAKGNQTSPGRAKGGKPGGAPTVNSGSSTVSKPRLITPPDPNSIATE